MYLICETPDNDPTVQEFIADKIPKYAILSHTWEEEEVTYLDMKDPISASKKQGWNKIQGCLSVAKCNGLDHIWVDTCCIDKSSSAELSEAINSMYRWYAEAEVCYAYLADISPKEAQTSQGPSEAQITASKWFTRGWTLQELVAPERVIFYDREWNEIGTKEGLQAEISQRTTIPTDILAGILDLDEMSVAQRMSWAAGRRTTRTEDRAYSLMGLFGINMPLLYGEGEMAFVRLQEEIIKSLDDYSIFAWRADSRSSRGALAATPDAFRASGNFVPIKSYGPINKSLLTVTNKGLHVQLVFVGIGPRGLGLAILPCILETEADDRVLLIGIYLRDIYMSLEEFERVHHDRLELLDMTNVLIHRYPVRSICIQQPRRAIGTSRKKRVKDGSFIVDATELDRLSDELRAMGVTAAQNEAGGHHKLAQEILSNGTAFGDVEKIRGLLFSHGVEVNLAGRYGKTLLIHAAQQGHTDIVWLLLSRSDTDINCLDALGMTPLAHAANEGYDSIVNLLLIAGANTEMKNIRGQSPFDLAVEKEHFQVIALLGSPMRPHLGYYD